MKTTSIYVFLACALFSVSSFAQTTPPNWVFAETIGGTAKEEAADVTTDNSGNVYVIGSFGSNPLQIGTLSVANGGGKDIYVAKYSPTGVPIWLKAFGGTGEDTGYTITSDGTNIYWSGTYTNNLYYNAGANFEPINGSVGKLNIAIFKMNGSGNVLWSNHAGGESFLAATCFPNDIQLLNGGGVVVAGSIEGEMKWGTTALGFTVKDTCNGCGFITRYGTNTGEYEWTYTVRRPNYMTNFDCVANIRQISIDNNNNIYAIGNSVNRIWNQPTKTIFPNSAVYNVNQPGLNTIDGQGQFDFYILKIGGDGLFLWQKSGGFGSTGNYSNYYTQGLSIWLDKNAQDLYFGGGFRGSYYYTGSAAGSTNAAGGNAFLIKADLNGNEVWEKHSTTTATNGGSSLNHISGNGKGGVYIGISAQAECNWYGQFAYGDINSFSQVMLARIEADGSTRWTKNIDGGAFQFVYPPAMHAISSATTDECWVAGSHSGFGIMFDSYLVQSSSFSADGLVAKLGTSGSTSAISAQDLSSLSLSPNPSHNEFRLQLAQEDKGEVFIYDAAGKLVHQQHFDNTKLIHVSTSLCAGIYAVQIKGNKMHKSLMWHNL